MIFIFRFDASSLTIFNQEDTTNTTCFTQSLGLCVVGLDPLHQGRESRWLRWKLNRLGYRDKKVKDRVIDTLMHGLRTKEHVCVEL